MDQDRKQSKSNNNNHTNNCNRTDTPTSRPKGRIFGIWPKRSTKVEPQNLNNADNQQKESSSHYVTFARCSPIKRAKTNNPNNQKRDSINSTNISSKNHSNFRLSHSSSRNKTFSLINNNRLSHQFHLCCSVDHKSQTPPVSVRYNSLPENVHILQPHHHHQDDSNLDLMSSSRKSAPLAEIEPECYSAPQSPINKNLISSSFNSQSSPSNTSVQSTQSDQPRSIAITACKSRLRLKLLPPGKTAAGINTENSDNTDANTQNVSSPNISSEDGNAQNHIQNGERRSMSQDAIQSIQRTSVVSTDSLAKQAIMAAQMLSLIPTEKARERNYMAGRLATNPLLGIQELVRVLPSKEAKIFVGTWNMNGQSPPKQMNDFVLPTGIEHVPDIVAIGTQESCSERFEWEVTLQETLGPTHILFHSAYLGTLHLAIFLRRDLIWFCSVPEDASMSVRPGTAFRTKGAVAISFALFGTSLLFVTSHLTAHQQKVKERVQDVKRIIHALDLPRNLKIRHKNKDVTQNFDSVFWCGDLNFRLGEPREKLLEWIQNTKFPLPPHLPHGYMHTDQLSSVLADGAAFKGFMEANIRFPPTYKYDPGTQQFDTSSKQRAPAYTDRILYKYRSSYLALRRASHISGPFMSQQPCPLECLAYDSVPSIMSSDHKPVWALFRNTIRPGIDTIPLAAGLFNREVYLEGMRRRLDSTETGSSAVCSIQ